MTEALRDVPHGCRSYRRIVVLDESYNEEQEESGDALSTSSFLSNDRSGEKTSAEEVSEQRRHEKSFVSHRTDSFIVSDDDYLTDDRSFSTSDCSESPEKAGEHVNRQTPRRVQGFRRAKAIVGNNVVDLVATKYESAVVVKSLNGCPPLFPHRDSCEMHSHGTTAETTSFDCDGSLRDESSSEDGQFERYLEKLRVENSSRREEKQMEGAHDESFVVTNSDISDTESNWESDASESSWSGSSNNDGKTKSAVNRKQLLKDLANSFRSPSLLLGRKKTELDPDEHFLVSLSANYCGTRHPDAQVYLRKGLKNKTRRTELTDRLTQLFRRECFKEELPEHLRVTWNPRLRKTAGMCRNRSDRSSWIELSPKVCNTPVKIVFETLLYTKCVMQLYGFWMDESKKLVNDTRFGAHQCMERFKSLPVIERCHNYEIDTKFVYECGGCGQLVKRHTKSLDIGQKICGICKCRFTLQVRSDASNAGPNEKLKNNPFAMFVKENYGKHKKPGVKHGEVMRILSQLYKEQGTSRTVTDSSNNKEELSDQLDISVLSI